MKTIIALGLLAAGVVAIGNSSATAAEAGNPEFGDATVALQNGEDIYVGTFRGDRISYFSLK
jgi:hypothetical protein